MNERMEVLFDTIRRRQASFTERTEESVRLGVIHMDNGVKKIKEVAVVVLETGLRLPGLLLLELLWRYQGLSVKDIPNNMIQPLSYLDIPTMLDFVHRRNFDHHAAIVLSYFVIFISLLFLTLPLNRLVRMYSHFISIFLFGVAYKLSAIYVDLELKSNEEELKLDGLVKLERHGFYCLSQILLAVLQSLLLEMDSEPLRIGLSGFAIPIVSRMCGCPRDKLKNAHNYACTGTMLFIAVYSLYRAPALIKSTKTALRQIKAVFLVHGLADGAVVMWRRLRIVELMTFTWITMFLMVLYVELIDKGRTWSEVGRILLSGVAETTNTPITLLALAISVSYVCKWIADLTKWITGGTRSHGHVLAHSGYTEAFSVLILCIQTGYLGMQVEQKAILLGLVLYIVISALLQSLFEIIEVVLLNLPSSPTASTGRHARCLVIAMFLVLFPVLSTNTMLALLPIDVWTAIIIANNVTVTIHALGVILKYLVLIAEAKSAEPWERSDDLIFYIDCVNKGLELLAAKAVMVFGCMQVVENGFSFATFSILLFHVVVNIYKRLEHLISFIRSRNAAVKNINRLSKADVVQLREREDLCAICFIEMREEARVTPCKHYFHGPCLRKWLAVKMVCPLCYSEMKEETLVPREPEREAADDEIEQVQQEETGRQLQRTEGEVERVNNTEGTNAAAGGGDLFDWDDLFGFREGREARNRDEQRLHRARDMWPLLSNDTYESDASDASEVSIDAQR